MSLVMDVSRTGKEEVVDVAALWDEEEEKVGVAVARGAVTRLYSQSPSAPWKERAGGRVSRWKIESS